MTINKINDQEEKRLQELAAAMREGGKEMLQVVSDFDRTLTHAFYDGEKTPSLMHHLRNGNYLSTEYAQKAQALFDFYHPIEISNSVSKEEKREAMFQWWSRHYNLLVECGLNEEVVKKAIGDIIAEGKIRLREGAEEFLHLLADKQIPLVIMSASGIGNMVTTFLKEKGLFSANVHFIGNTLEFDEKGVFKGVENNKIIHTMNKDETELQDLPIYEELLQRKNLILIGDSLDDLKMAEGFPWKNMVKFGFLNYEEDKKADFQKGFDWIIENDGDMLAINNFLRAVIGE